MADYISREAAIKLICGDRCGCHHYECGRDTKNCRPVELLKSIPAADVVEVVHGRWRCYEAQYSCMQCGSEVDEMSKYCPNCGAKMDGGADNVAD